MSAGQHEVMATDAERVAEIHSALYDAGAVMRIKHCGARGGCWTSVRNPTARHLDEAARYRKMAADHRAASQALRDAEMRACVGLSDEDRDMSPFAHHEDIASVEPLTVGTNAEKGQSVRTVGATIAFRALPGTSAPWLQRVIDCHLARNAAMGHESAEMPDCPLVPKGVSAQVRTVGTGFAVEVRSDDSGTAVAILRRARALVGD
jgi:hypothetical protein